MSETLNTAADQVVHCLLIGSVAALILVPAAWVILKAARIQTPVYRHLIWLDCLIGVVVLPLLWLAGPKLTLTVLPGRVEARAPAVSPPSHDDVGTMAAESSPMVPAETERQSTVGTQPRLAQWQTAVAGLWLAGFAFMLSRLAVGWHHLRHICLSATPISGRQVRHALDGHRLTIRLTRQLQGPVCFGLLRPVILLPEEMYESGTSESLRMILTHELAHLARRDAWINLFQRLVEAACFFHPFIWFASRQLTQQREQICDNHVLAEGASPTDYSTLLSRIGERALRARHPQTVALFEGHLLARIRSLLDPRGSRQTKLPRRLAALCTVAVLAAFLIFGSVRLAAQPGAGPSSVAQASPSSTKEAGSSAKAATQSMANGESRSAESLHHAARDGDLEQVKTLIARGANVNTVDKDDLTPLYWAALKGHRDVVEFLLRKGANVNCVEQGDLFTPLHGAACNAHLDMVEFLVAKGANVNAQDKGGYTPLIHVIWNKDKAMTAFLVTHGAKLDLKDKEGFTAWHRAAEQGSRDLLELSAQSADVSSLPRAAVLGDLARVQRAVEEGAGVNAGDDLGWTPLYWAACTGRTEVARFLVSRGAEVSAKDELGDAPIHSAASPEVAEVLLAHGASLNAPGRLNMTPLGSAALNRRSAVVKLLLQKGAEVNAWDRYGTPLHLAVMGRDADVIELLLAAGADVNAKDKKKGQTPLHIAADAARPRLMEILLAHGADVNSRDRNGQTPLHWVCKNPRVQAATLLKAAEFLLAAGADVNARDNQQQTALSLAKQQGYEEVAALLRQHGAKE